LVKAIEEHQRIRSSVIEPSSHVRHVAEKWAQLDRDRDSDFRFHGCEKVNVNLLDLAAAAIQVRRNIVNVEF
jgi:hypothetical protein